VVGQVCCSLEKTAKYLVGTGRRPVTPPPATAHSALGAAGHHRLPSLLFLPPRNIFNPSGENDNKNGRRLSGFLFQALPAES
jgi:hypothetical protein